MAWRTHSQLRTVEVLPPSAADEAGWVFLAAGIVLLGVIYTYGFEREGARGTAIQGSAGSGMLPYQVLFRDLPSPEQRTFRAMQEGMAEAVRLRGDNGSWASVDQLADDGVPPFAADVLDKSGLRWSGQVDGLFVNYLGVPQQGSPAFLIFVQEPDPVTGEKPPPPSVVDEEHHVLPDNTLLHVTYWKRVGMSGNRGLIIDPALEGWQQIRVKTPLEEMEQQ